jgi:alpha-L-rhamnosidase
MRLFLNSSYILVVAFLHVCCPALAGQQLQVNNLRCEHLVNPIGIDQLQPRFSWRMETDRKNTRQAAYRYFLGTDSAGVATGKAVYWGSEKIMSAANLVTYQGKPLTPYTRFYWRVEIWESGNVTPLSSAVVYFETGLMDQKNWKGIWISDTRDVQLKAAPYFRKGFALSKPIRSARAYIAAAGLYELSINGQKAGNHRLDPMFTRYDRRNLYVTYDVTALLQNGENAVGVLLGNGWYNHQSTAVWYFHQAPWRARPTFCLDLRITYQDGTVETISSGKGWKTTTGPIIFNSIYTGEHYDARLELGEWDRPGYDDSQWKGTINRAAPALNIVAQTMEPIRDVEQIAARSMTRVDSLVYVFDLGRNIAGVSRITVRGAAGTVLRVKHGERLFKNGRVDLSNIVGHYRPTDDKDPFQTDIYTLSGKGEETFMPRFNYKGFQYIEVTASAPIEISRNSLTAWFMHSDLSVAGTIRSSNPMLNKIWEATNNSYLSNLFGYPTDCPQREKNGWTGDAHINIETGLYNYDAITIYEKWMADHRDEQQPNGILPCIIPTSGWGYESGHGPDWTSTIAIIPWNLYLFYGDSKALADCYAPIKRYIDYINSIYPTGLTSWGLGDWVPVKSNASVELTSTAYYYASTVILAKAAKLFGKTNDQVFYSALSEKIKRAFNAKYFNSTTGIYGTGIQTEMSVPLYWGLVPAEQIDRVAANLARRVEEDGNKLDVGLLGTKAILNALSEHGYGDLAYRLATSDKYPSWGYWIANGATTLYENWPLDAQNDISMNHIMFGEIGAWLYKGIGGIKPDERKPGFKNVLLEPHFVEGLDMFEASHEGPYGQVLSAWKKEGKLIKWQVTIPPNSTATIQLPGRKVSLEGKPMQSDKPFELGAGSYLFEIL